MKKTVSFFTIIVLMIFNRIQAQNKCYIYLTFDDGPLNGSENINDIILKEKVKISVFMVGEHVIKNKQIYRINNKTWG